MNVASPRPELLVTVNGSWATAASAGGTPTSAASTATTAPNTAVRYRMSGSPLVLVELLGGGAVAVPDLQPGAVGRRAAGGVQAATRLRVLQRPVGLDDPVLGAGAVAVPQLDLRAVGGAAGDHVHAPAEGLQGLAA